MDFKTIERPYLIQRGSFRNITDEQIEGLDSLVCFDYMGSAEFEFGSLPRSLRIITGNWKDFIHFQMDSIQDGDGQYLQVLCHKNQAEEIKDAIINLFSKNCTIRTKEFTGMYDYLSCNSQRLIETDFWWDVTSGNNEHYIQSSWMCCFGDNIRRLIIALRKVWCKHHNIPVDVSEPKHGPNIPAPITKPRPSKLTVDYNLNNIIVTTVMGNRTVISKKGVVSYEANEKRILVTVRTKSGSEKILKIVAEPSRGRMLLENMLDERININKYMTNKTLTKEA